MKAYTDYPDLKMRPVTVVDYDHDKYVTVIFLDNINIKDEKFKNDFYLNEKNQICAEIKQGYLYRTKMKKRIKHKTLGRRFS